MKIALVGYSRAGKDTVAKIIEDSLVSCKTLALGDSMKSLFHELFPNIEKEPKPRTQYEDFAQSMRKFDEDVFIKMLEKKLSFYRGNKHFIITDIRQPNEAKWAKENGFVLVEVWSPLGLRMQRAENDGSFVAVNKSEEFLHEIECEYTIKNHTTEEELKERVQNFMTLLKMLEENKNETASDRGDEKSNINHGKQGRTKKKH